MKTHRAVGNARFDTEDVKAGALCYIENFSLATGGVEVYVINRDGEWISQWRAGDTLTNYRAKMVPAKHPMAAGALNAAAARARAATLAKAFSSPDGESEVPEQPETQP